MVSPTEFQKAISTALKIMPEQMAVTQIVRQMTEAERKIFQDTINSHPLMVKDLEGKDERDRKEIEASCKEELEEIKNLSLKAIESLKKEMKEQGIPDINPLTEIKPKKSWFKKWFMKWFMDYN